MGLISVNFYKYYKKYFLLRFLPVALFLVTTLISVTLPYFSASGLVPIKKDQEAYLSFGKNLKETNILNFKEVAKSNSERNITLHKGMWWLSLVLNKTSYFPVYSMRLLNLVLHLISTFLIIAFFRKFYDDFTSQKMGLIYAIMPSLNVFNLLYLKDSILVFSIACMFYLFQLLLNSKYLRAFVLLVTTLFIQYHLRMVTMAFTLIGTVNFLLLIKFRKAKDISFMLIFEAFGMFVLGKLLKFYPPILNQVMGGLQKIFSTVPRFIDFITHFFIETLGFSLFLRSPEVLEVNIWKHVAMRLVIIDSIVIPLMAFYFLIRDLLKRNYEALFIGFAPIFIYFLVYYYHYQYLGLRSLYSFRISLPVHVFFIIYVLIRFFQPKAKCQGLDVEV